MFITEEQLEERLNSPRNLANLFKRGKLVQNDETEISETTDQIEQTTNQIEFREIKRPGNNRPWLSSEERNQIAFERIEGKSQTEIALRHGVEVSTVSDIVNNTRRAENTSRSVNQAEIDRALDKVREAAIDKLMSSLGHLTDDKISALGAKDLSSVASNMARVVQQTMPQEKAGVSINLVVYTPELRQEKNFDSVEV